MRHRPPLLRTVLLLGGTFVTTALLILVVFRIDRVVVAAGEFEGHSQPVRAPRTGSILEVLVTPGTRVEAGTPLLRLDCAALDAERAAGEARHDGLTAERTAVADERGRLVSSLHPAEHVDLEHARERAQYVLEAARQKEARYAELQVDGLVKGLEAEEVRLARKVAEIDLLETEEALVALPERQALALDSIDARALELQRELSELAVHRAELERQLDMSTLAAPVSGWVFGARSQELVGLVVEEGDEVMRVAVEGVERFLARVDDRGRARIRTGLPANLRLEGYPWLTHGTLAAQVEFVGERRDGESGFLVLLSIDTTDTPGALFEGMRGRARIVTEARVSILRLIFERLVRIGES